MKKSETTLDLEFIKLLCALSILQELQRESVTKELKKLNFYSVLD